MINEERVKELYHMAVYDDHKSKADCQMGQYYMWDYVCKELVKSFFTGSIAFVLLVVLWGMSDVETITAVINSLEIVDLAIRIGVLYIGFLAIYLFITLLVYCFRYVYGRKKLRQYAGHLKKVQKMYQREEKLKA